MRRWSIVLLFAFTGCASSSPRPEQPTVWFRSPDGIIASCEHEGTGALWLKYGLIFAAMGPDRAYQNCVDVAKEKGWVQIDKPER